MSAQAAESLQYLEIFTCLHMLLIYMTDYVTDMYDGFFY